MRTGLQRGRLRGFLVGLLRTLLRGLRPSSFVSNVAHVTGAPERRGWFGRNRLFGRSGWFGQRATRADDEAVEVAAIVRRVAMLATAGLGTEQLWQYLGGQPRQHAASAAASSAAAPTIAPVTPGAVGNHGAPMSAHTAEIVRQCRLAANRPERLPAAIRQAARLVYAKQSGAARQRDSEAAVASWCGFAAVLSLAQQTGAPIATNCVRLAESLDDNAETRRLIGTHLAAAQATTNFMRWLPPASLLLGMLLGFDPIRVLTTNPLGIASALLGLTLNVLAHRWSGALVQRARPQQHTPGLVIDLVALGVGGGGSLAQANRVVADTVERFGLNEADELERAQHTLELAAEAGIPAVQLLRADAELYRAEHRAAGITRAQALSVALMLPLGCCTLPAFVLFGVVPLMISIFRVAVHT